MHVCAHRCAYTTWAFMSVDSAPATILCLPWKSRTLNPKRVSDPLTADQQRQWRSQNIRAAARSGEDCITLPLRNTRYILSRTRPAVSSFNNLLVISRRRSDFHRVVSSNVVSCTFMSRLVILFLCYTQICASVNSSFKLRIRRTV